MARTLTTLLWRIQRVRMIAFPKDVVVDGLVGIGQIHNGTAPGRSLVPGGMPASAARLT